MNKPSNLELEIVNTAKEAIKESIVQSLTGYQGALTKLCNDVMHNHDEPLRQLVNEEFSELITAEPFREALREALHEKLAKVLIARMGGELEKQVNALKQNPETRAKITLAIDRVVRELPG